jgi:hypothetical protein
MTDKPLAEKMRELHAVRTDLPDDWLKVVRELEESSMPFRYPQNKMMDTQDADTKKFLWCLDKACRYWFEASGERWV